jgi:hypothetical protein
MEREGEVWRSIHLLSAVCVGVLPVPCHSLGTSALQDPRPQQPLCVLKVR